METIYIKDIENQAIGNEISRLCLLADMEPPNGPAEVCELIRKRFWKYEPLIMRAAFDAFLQGYYEDILRLKKCNVKLLCDILAEYVKSNHHKLKFYKPLELPPPPPTPEEVEQRFHRSIALLHKSYVKCMNHGGNDGLSIWMLHIMWGELVSRGLASEDMFDQAQILDASERLVEYDRRSAESIARGLPENKRRTFQQTMSAVVNAIGIGEKRQHAPYMACYFERYGLTKINHENN